MIKPNTDLIKKVSEHREQMRQSSKNLLINYKEQLELTTALTDQLLMADFGIDFEQIAPLTAKTAKDRKNNVIKGKHVTRQKIPFKVAEIKRDKKNQSYIVTEIWEVHMKDGSKYSIENPHLIEHLWKDTELGYNDEKCKEHTSCSLRTS